MGNVSSLKEEFAATHAKVLIVASVVVLLIASLTIESGHGLWVLLAAVLGGVTFVALLLQAATVNPNQKPRHDQGL
jgi:hypothetical protein